MGREKIILLIAVVLCALVSPLHALETGIENLEVWGYVQNEMQFAQLTTGYCTTLCGQICESAPWFSSGSLCYKRVAQREHEINMRVP